jgi:hypothetical protein
MEAQMSLHISQSNDLVAKMTFSCAGTICKLVRCEAAEENFRIHEGWVIGTLLWYDEMAELAKYFFAWADRCSVAGKVGKVRCREVAIRALYGGWWVKNGVVLGFGCECVAVGVIAGTVPMVLPSVGVLEEDI